MCNELVCVDCKTMDSIMWLKKNDRHYCDYCFGTQCGVDLRAYEAYFNGDDDDDEDEKAAEVKVKPESVPAPPGDKSTKTNGQQQTQSVASTSKPEKISEERKQAAYNLFQEVLGKIFRGNLIVRNLLYPLIESEIVSKPRSDFISTSMEWKIEDKKLYFF